MDLPADVLVVNAAAGMDRTAATLLGIADGHYELNARFGDSLHRVLLPIAQTVIILRAQEEQFVTEDEDIER